MQVHFHLPYTNSLNLYQSISINQYQYQSLSPLPVVLPKLDHQTRAAAAAAQKTTPKKGGKIPNLMAKIQIWPGCHLLDYILR